MNCEGNVHLITEDFKFFLRYTVELGYNVMKGTEYFVSLKTSVVRTKEYSVMVNSEELIGTAGHVTL
jgi:hypothetical protein